MNKNIKVGDTVEMLESANSKYVFIKEGVTGQVIRVDGDGDIKIKVASVKINSDLYRIGETAIISDEYVKLVSNKNTVAKKPIFYCEIQEEISDKKRKESEEITKELTDCLDGSAKFIDGRFSIRGEFTIEEAIKLKRYLAKMTAKPTKVKKKAVKKVAKKK